MNTERDKFLTEAMGECWHDCYNYVCRHCEKMFPDSNSNFSTWEGFGKLWEWSSKQDWWIYFVDDYQTTKHGLLNIEHYLDYVVSPDKFANAVYDYLKEQVE